MSRPLRVRCSNAISQERSESSENTRGLVPSVPRLQRKCAVLNRLLPSGHGSFSVGRSDFNTLFSSLKYLIRANGQQKVFYIKYRCNCSYIIPMFRHSSTMYYQCYRMCHGHISDWNSLPKHIVNIQESFGFRAALATCFNS